MELNSNQFKQTLAVVISCLTISGTALADRSRRWIFETQTPGQLVLIDTQARSQIGYTVFIATGKHWTEYKVLDYSQPRNIDFRLQLESGGYLQVDAGLSPTVKSMLVLPNQRVLSLKNQKKLEYFLKDEKSGDWIAIEMSRQIQRVTVYESKEMRSIEIFQREFLPDGGTQILTLQDGGQITIPGFVHEDQRAQYLDRDRNERYFYQADVKPHLRKMMEQNILTNAVMSCRRMLKGK